MLHIDVYYWSCRGDCGMFTIVNAYCLAQGKQIGTWATQERMGLYRQYMSCHLWYHTKLKNEENAETDIEIDHSWDDAIM